MYGKEPADVISRDQTLPTDINALHHQKIIEKRIQLGIDFEVLQLYFIMTECFK